MGRDYSHLRTIYIGKCPGDGTTVILLKGIRDGVYLQGKNGSKPSELPYDVETVLTASDETLRKMLEDDRIIDKYHQRR